MLQCKEMLTLLLSILLIDKKVNLQNFAKQHIYLSSLSFPTNFLITKSGLNVNNTEISGICETVSFYWLLVATLRIG